MKLSFAHLTCAVAACSSTLALASPAHAASGEDKTPLNLPASEPARDAASNGGGGGIARMVVGLAVVIGVIYGLSWVLKQVKASREGAATGTALAAVSALPLGPNRSVQLVRAGSDLVLLGVAEKGITTIRTYTEPEARAAGLIGDDDLPALAPGRPADAPAANILDALRKRTVRR